MAMMARDIKSLIEVYDLLLKSGNPGKDWPLLKAKFPKWLDSLIEVCRPPFDSSLINELAENSPQFSELMVLDASTLDSTASLAATVKIRDLAQSLVFYGGAAAKKLGDALLGSMMIGIEALSEECAQEIIDCLCDIVETNLGRTPKWTGYRRRYGEPAPQYFDILNGTLYAEVVRFYNTKRSTELLKEHKEVLKEIECPVISVGSRKGGTGKSLYLMAATSWFHDKGYRDICVLDLDLSGPVWQYLLFPERNRPKRFLNDMIDTNQDYRKGFTFPTGFRDADVQNLADRANYPFAEKGKVAHLGIRDIPGINRTLTMAAELNRDTFYPFLASVIAALSKKHDCILIDNSPGFDSVPYASLVLASSVKQGAAFVVCTPALPDLAGTFLELAEFRLTNTLRSPVWVINKSTPESEKFTSVPRTAYETAKQLQAYDSELPQRPLLEKILKPRYACDLWEHLPMDDSVKDILFVDAKGRPKKPNLMKTEYLRSVWKVLDKSLPDLCGGPRGER